jgi:hypothetical protein
MAATWRLKWECSAGHVSVEEVDFESGDLPAAIPCPKTLCIRCLEGGRVETMIPVLERFEAVGVARPEGQWRRQMDLL